MVASAFQGHLWGIVKDCTCLWVNEISQGWQMVADDANCPAHHPDKIIGGHQW